MIPIKILCGCGQKYAFDVEPAGGRMGYAVQCPVCGADGTAATSQMIAQHQATRAAPAPGLRIGGQKPSPMVRTPPLQKMSPATQVGNSRGAQPRKEWLVPLIGGIVVLVLVASIGRNNGGPAAVTKDDFPRTLKELNAWYAEPPVGQNAATFYLQGFNALQIAHASSSNVPLLGNGKLPPLGGPMPTPVKSALVALVDSNRDALQFFALGENYEQSRYPVNLALGFETVLPHLPRVKSASLLVELSAILHAEANDGKQAANHVLMALALARSLEAEPALLSQSVRAANVTTAVAALEQTANRAALPRESLNELAKAFQKMEAYDARGEGFNRAMAAERATWLAMLGTPQKLLEALTLPGADIPAEQRNQIAARLQKADNLKDEQQYFEKSFQQLMAIRKKAFPDRLKADNLIRQRVTEAAHKPLVVMGLLLPGLAGPTAKEAECLAHLRLGLTAVALEQFRAVHGNRYPAALSELTPDYVTATPVDPFNGQPLRYRMNGGGYVLYSIGCNLKDDSGERMDGREGDIVFAVVTPPKLRP